MDVLDTLRTRLADRYELEKEIGRGGMATVYLARDIRHNRRVALKVLNPELGAVLGVERFLAEIQVTANLQHPNLLPLFDSGEADGLLFYVMPFIEGESLRALLQREKQLPIDGAVRMMSAILSALDYAHRHGVIHRDLKPENILVHEGQPLIADFGIALAVSNAGGNRITQTGLSLGTPHYMSPEQATGDREIDARTDVYSAGAVLYEMLVGEPPHDGKTSQAVIAKVLTDKPRRIRLARDTVPEFVEEAVDVALAKLPADRFRTAQEFADALNTRGGLRTGMAPAPARATQAAEGRLGRLFPWAIAAVAVGIAGAAAVRGPSHASVATTRDELVPPANATWVPTTTRLVAASPTGGTVAYVALDADSVSRLYLRDASDVVPRVLAGTEGAAAPFFSSDGEWIAFLAGGQLRKMPVAGGRVTAVAEAPGTHYSWSSTGWIVMGTRDAVLRAPADGGEFQSFATVDSSRAAYNTVPLADGETFLISLQGMGGVTTARLGEVSMKSGAVRTYDLLGVAPLGMVEGHLVYATAAGNVMAVPFNERSRKFSGSSIALPDQVLVDAATGGIQASMAPDGTLIYISGATRRQPVIIAPNGVVRTLGDPGLGAWPRFSPDGRRVALSLGSGTRREIWVAELGSGSNSQVTTGGTLNDRPEWTPDGQSLVFRSDRGGRNAIYLQRVDGAGTAQLLHSDAVAQVDEGVVSPDGRWLALQRDSTGDGELWIAPMSDPARATRIEPSNGAYGARISPDGQWVAYAFGGSADNQDVVVRRVDGSGGRLRVSVGAGSTPVWSADGKSIYFVRGREIRRVAVLGTDPFRVSAPETVLSGPYVFNTVHADFDVARDGSIIAFRTPTQSAPMVVVRNLGAEIRARAQAAPR